MNLLDTTRNPVVRNPGVVFVFCVALAVLALLIRPATAFTGGIIFVLAAIMIFIIRPVYDEHIKALCYVLLGMAIYTICDDVFVTFIAEPSVPAPVILAVSAAGALAALVTHVEGKNFGAIFASGSLVLIFFAENNPFSLLAAFLTFLSVYWVVHFISRIRGSENFLPNVLAASCGSGAFVFLVGILVITAGASFPTDASRMMESMLLIVFTSAGFIMADLSIFDVMLKRFDFKRTIEEGRVLYCSIEPPPKELLGGRAVGKKRGLVRKSDS